MDINCNVIYMRDYFTKNNEHQVGELINIANVTEDGIKILKKIYSKRNSNTKAKRNI